MDSSYLCCIIYFWGSIVQHYFCSIWDPTWIHPGSLALSDMHIWCSWSWFLWWNIESDVCWWHTFMEVSSMIMCTYRETLTVFQAAISVTKCIASCSLCVLYQAILRATSEWWNYGTCVASVLSHSHLLITLMYRNSYVGVEYFNS